jgi:hypothetical protein
MARLRELRHHGAAQPRRVSERSNGRSFRLPSCRKLSLGRVAGAFDQATFHFHTHVPSPTLTTAMLQSSRRGAASNLKLNRAYGGTEIIQDKQTAPRLSRRRFWLIAAHFAVQSPSPHLQIPIAWVPVWSAALMAAHPP